MRHVCRLICATAVLSLVLAGCTSPGSDADGEPPVVTPSASTQSTETGEDRFEHVARDMVRCLTGRGWNVEVTGDRSFGAAGGIPPEQYDQYQADKDECRTQLGFDLSPPSVTQQEAEELYDVLLEVADCVRGLGYDVPDPPSKQAFVEDLLRRPIPSWHPYDVVANGPNPSTILGVRSECPVPEVR